MSIIAVRLRLIKHASVLATSTCRTLAMRPGTIIPGLNFLKDQEPVVALPREEYPDWVSTLATPQAGLAKLRRMSEEEATEREKERYLKLTRRIELKKKNAEAEAGV
jgi:hypothetical protein